MAKGWNPDIGRDPWWWLGCIAGFFTVIGGAIGWTLKRKLSR